MKVSFLAVVLFSFCAVAQDEFADITIPETVATQFSSTYKISEGQIFKDVIEQWSNQAGVKPVFKLADFKGLQNISFPSDAVFDDDLVNAVDVLIGKVNDYILKDNPGVFLFSCLYKEPTNPTLLIEVNTNECP